GFGFAIEALAQIGIGSKAFGKDFDGDITAEARIARAIDLAHPTRTCNGDDLVGPELLASCQHEGWPNYRLIRTARGHNREPSTRSGHLVESCACILRPKSSARDAGTT